jgi:hypothetical protein
MRAEDDLARVFHSQVFRRTHGHDSYSCRNVTNLHGFLIVQMCELGVISLCSCDIVIHLPDV